VSSHCRWRRVSTVISGAPSRSGGSCSSADGPRHAACRQIRRLRTLGEIQLLASGHRVPLGPRKQRTLLAAFLVDAGRSVPADTLIDRVWADAAPAESRNVLYTYVTRLRRILISADVSAPALRRQAGGYLLDIDPGQVDLHRLRRRAAEARRFSVDDRRRLSPLREAAELWRGEPLAGLPGQWVTRVQEGLRQQLLGVLSEWADAELRFGRPGHVTDRLSRVLDTYPLAETLVAHLMRALYVDGRRAEALEQYTRTRKHLLDELGVDPSIELQELHRDMLSGNVDGARSGVTVAVDASAAAEPTEPGGVGFGCRLPVDLFRRRPASCSQSPSFAPSRDHAPTGSAISGSISHASISTCSCQSASSTRSSWCRRGCRRHLPQV
jgi:DNA-binding SARP family transcriptional activator